MELTRRDAVGALAALGVAGALAAGARRRDAGSGAGGPDDVDVDRVRETLLAAATVVYPEDVSGTEAFLETFLDGRLADRDHAAAMAETVAELDERAEAWHGERFVDLPAAGRDRLLREVGADTADEDPDGTTAERVRYYVVNELLLALFASPAGGELVGIENPQGHPGGLESYRRGPTP